jgi:hypothetical protein
MEVYNRVRDTVSHKLEGYVDVRSPYFLDLARTNRGSLLGPCRLLANLSILELLMVDIRPSHYSDYTFQRQCITRLYQCH